MYTWVFDGKGLLWIRESDAADYASDHPNLIIFEAELITSA